MGGKNKHKGKHHHRSNNNHSNNDYAPRMTEDEICDLVTEATEIHTLLNDRHQQIKKVENFVHILSTKWLRDWKDYVGYDELYAEGESKGKKKQGKRKPGAPNTDLLSSNKQFFTIPEENMPEYSYLNKVLNDKLSMGEDFIAVTAELWQKFDSIYGPGQQILRPVRKLKSGKNYIDGELLKSDFFFINYNNPELEEKLTTVKNHTTKLLQDLLPSNSFQMSTIWTLDDLYKFLEEYCDATYECKDITLWKCDNFLGLKSLQQKFGQSVKDKSYEMYAYKLDIDDEQLDDVDLDDFLKIQHTLIVEIGASKIVTARLPDDLFGYCDECIEKRKLLFHCECNRVHYCSRECQADDQVWHFKTCKSAFESDDDDEYRKKKGHKVSRCGLKNLGNTCYMNSSIQMFLGLKFLTETLCSSKIQKIADQKQEDGAMFLQKISKTCKIMGEAKDMTSIEPWSLKSQVNYFLPPFKGYKQHDAIDFLTGFLNTLNECLIKPKQSAYSTLFKDNIMGSFDSLVICPNCDLQVKNEQDFLQVNLPIKSKTNKVFYNYVKFQTPLLYSFGRAQVSALWGDMKKQVSVPEDCLMFSGRDGEEELIQIDESNGEQPEKIIKKIKKDILFFPNEKYDKNNEIWISCSMIFMKTICGEQMRAVSGFPFPIIIESTKTVAHIFLQILKKFCNDHPSCAVIPEIEGDYDAMINFKTERLTEISKKKSKDKEELGKKEMEDQKDQKNQKVEGYKEQGKDDEQSQDKYEEETKQVEEKIDMMAEELNKKVREILSELRIKVYIEDKKKIKNVCFFCRKKCKGCSLLPMFEQNLFDFFAHKLRDAKINLFFENKLEVAKEKNDLADNGDSTLQDCLALFGEPEQLDEENAWWCSTCEDMRLAYKQIHIKSFPKYFLIQLSRFKNGANGKVKNNEPIYYKQYETFGQHKYRLLGAIIHEGSIEGGHYWAIGLRENDYYIFNDEKVTKTDKFCNKGAYILCYRRFEQ